MGRGISRGSVFSTSVSKELRPRAGKIDRCPRSRKQRTVPNRCRWVRGEQWLSVVQIRAWFKRETEAAPLEDARWCRGSTREITLNAGDLTSSLDLSATRDRRRRVSLARTLPKGSSLPALEAALVILAHSSTNSPSSTLVEKASAKKNRRVDLRLGDAFL
jgi:hypothetical protein